LPNIITDQNGKIIVRPTRKRYDELKHLGILK
jgi:hypothetical protein